jgi:hypothetical protein
MARETRGASGKILFFTACLAVGVAAIVAGGVIGLTLGTVAVGAELDPAGLARLATRGARGLTEPPHPSHTTPIQPA